MSATHSQDIYSSKDMICGVLMKQRDGAVIGIGPDTQQSWCDWYRARTEERLVWKECRIS